jgi:tetratricopeptide (TPR) repeat protein
MNAHNFAMKKIEDIIGKIRKANELGKIDDCIEFCREGISLTDPSDFENWYGLRINLANFLIKSDTDTSSKNIEEAISINNEILRKLSLEKNPREWASINRNLGLLFYQRLEDDKKTNLAKAINYYTDATTVFTKRAYPEDWAMLKAAIGLAWSEQKGKEDQENIVKAIECYLDTLSVYTKSGFPEDYKDSLQELNSLRKRLNDEEKWNELFDKIKIE